jgi:membrane protein
MTPGWWGAPQDPQARDTVTSAVVGIVPLSSQGTQQLHHLIGSVSGGGALGLLGLIGVLWSASGVMATVRTALNIAWDTDAKRPFFRGKLVDLALVAGAFLAIGATLGVTLAETVIRPPSGTGTAPEGSGYRGSPPA